MRSRRQAGLAVLCSGAGTNLQAILTAIRRGRLSARVAVVISDRPQAAALTRARRVGVPTVVVEPRRYPSRNAYDAALAATIKRAGAEWVILAGFLRILSPGFVRRFAGRLLNIHPALLPAFSGAHAIRDALAYGVNVTGVTVHLVDEQVDHGPIVAQQAVPVRPGDTEATLLARIHRVEHHLYPRVIQWAIDGRLRVLGRHVRLRAGFRTRFRREKAEGRGEAKAERRKRIPTGDTPRNENAGIARPAAFAAETRVVKPALSGRG